ncbi:MAG: redoxin family protein [candidate division Zixibacteria bacterium]|nr:redoxin family protein [candidate division Zixibacteria bacterium]
MTEKSSLLKTHLWSIILIVLVIAMGIEILFLVSENRKLRSALTARRGPFTVLNPEERVPPLVGIDLNGQEVRVEYPSSEQTVFFWFSAACPSCEHNVEFWREMYRKRSSPELRFFGVTTAGEGKTEELTEKFPFEFPILTVSDYSLLDQYKVEVIPQTMLIDENGLVRKVWPGPLSENYKIEIEEMITSSSGS